VKRLGSLEKKAFKKKEKTADAEAPSFPQSSWETRNQPQEQMPRRAGSAAGKAPQAC
jgi:hypothetical protein